MFEDFKSTLNWLDILVIVLYMLGTLAIGYVAQRKMAKNMENFFLAGRKVPGWANGFSYAAACLNSDVAPAYIAWTVGTGLFISWLYVSRFGLAFMIGGLLFAVFWRRLKLFTSPEFYELRFPGKAGATLRGWIATRSAFIAIVAWSGTGLLGISKVTEPVFGWDKLETIAIIIPAVMLYVFMSGYLGVIYTDVFQTIVMIAASLAMCGFVLHEFGGPAGLLAALERVGKPEVLNSFPPLTHADLGAVAVVTLFLATGIGYGGDVAPMGGAMEGQRILSSKNEREAVKMYVWTEIILFVLLLVLTLPGLAAIAKWPEMHEASRAARETVFGQLLVEYMPPGLMGLAIAALLAAIMSTLSANFNFGAQIATNDLYRRFLVRDKPEKHYIFVGRGVLFLICALSIIVALKAESMINVAVFMIGLSSAELAANWAQWWWWRFNSAGRLAASFGGPAIYLLVRFVATPLLAKQGIELGEFPQVLVAMGLTAVLWVTVTLLTPPQPEAELIEFYKRARPMGFWGPIRRALGEPERQHDLAMILKGFGLAALGAAWIAAMLICFSNLFVGLYAKGAAYGAGAIVGAVLFKIGFTHYVDTVLKGAGDEQAAEAAAAQDAATSSVKGVDV